ncbi:MAG: prepilin-type N-terminal cleavage/methylation domain-containing protein, partial [candidate division NC10 bacterium]
MRRMLRDQRGFTLTELLVVTAVLAVVLGAVILIQQKGQEAYIMGSNRVETQQNARVALDLMTRELRSATAVTAIP